MYPSRTIRIIKSWYFDWNKILVGINSYPFNTKKNTG